MCYDYDEILRPEKAKRIFNLERSEREEIVGSKKDWENAIDDHLFY